MSKDLIPIERIENRIYLIRGQKVMLDFDLAGLYGVTTGRLNEQVKRNIDRFPGDFMFALKREEILNISQIAICSSGKKVKHSKNINAFTEQGVAMLSSVLHSRRAILVNIQIMRTFVRLKQILISHKAIRQKISLLEQKFGKHLRKHDLEIQAIFDVIRKLMEPPEKPARRIGFIQGE